MGSFQISIIMYTVGFLFLVFQKESPMEMIRIISCMSSLGAQKPTIQRIMKLLTKSPKICELQNFPSDLWYGFSSTFQPRSLCHSWPSLQCGTLPNFLFIGTPLLGENRCHIVITYPVKKGGKILQHGKQTN